MPTNLKPFFLIARLGSLEYVAIPEGACFRVAIRGSDAKLYRLARGAAAKVYRRRAGPFAPPDCEREIAGERSPGMLK